MYDPRTPESGAGSAGEGLKNWYLSMKDEYLELCWQYNLPPRDMSLLLMGEREIGSTDRIRLIRLIVNLMDLEKLMKPGAVEDYLFTENEEHYKNSIMFTGGLH